MSEARQPNLLHRLRNTPMRDLVRGRVTGRLDIAARIEGAGLPAPATDLIRRVMRKTRLWSLEKLDVADELIAHFRDGLDAGETVEQLVTSFGDEIRAAKLIRRAKVRNRPIAWHALRGLGWIVAALVVLYLLLAAYFYTGRPTPSVNYYERLNGRGNAVAPDQRAWPMYRDAILEIGQLTTAQKATFEKLLDARPRREHWSQAVAWLRANGHALQLIRSASRKPELGFVLGPGGSANDPQVFPDATPQLSDGDLISTRIPHVAELRRIARLLALDARLAREESDRQRLLADVEAISNLGKQLHGNAFVLGDLSSLYIRGMALDLLDEILATNPAVFSDADLQDLAHRESEPHVAADLFDPRGERFFVGDIVQRIYTDDGHGDGRLTPAGLDYLRMIGSGGNARTASPLLLAYGP